MILCDFLITVKAAPHESVIKTGQSQTYTLNHNNLTIKPTDQPHFEAAEVIDGS